MASAVLLLYRMGSISWTWDEQVDMAIVDCLKASHNPFSCLTDIEQVRLPFYIHAAAATVAPWPNTHYFVSALFALLNVVLIFILARDRFGERTALVAMALTATAPAILASGRMLLSHSNVILTTFTLAMVVAYDRFDRTHDRRYFWLSAAALGLAVASSVLGVLTALVVAGYWLGNRSLRRLWQPCAYAAVAGMVFLVSTVIYVHPSNLYTMVDATLHAHIFPEWNVLQLGSNHAPRWYSPLLFAIKIGPWWALLFAIAPLVLRQGNVGEGGRRVVLAIWGAFVTYLVIKSGLFRYDAPHQQAVWYPLLFVVVAATGMEVVRRAAAVGKAASVALVVVALVHVSDTVRFFPNYLFYGAQYGTRFIGEFYGPAVFHAQDRAGTDQKLDAIISADPSVRILMADNNAFERSDEHFVPFTQMDAATRYPYAVVDRLYATHFRFPERETYNRFLAENYVVVHSHAFPTHKWAYRILRARASS